MDQGGAQEQ
jgi:hypothetical protein